LELAGLPALELASLIASRDCSPVELIDATFARIETANGVERALRHQALQAIQEVIRIQRGVRETVNGALDLARKGVRTSGDPRNRDFAAAHNNAGLLLRERGDLAGARGHFAQAVAAAPAFAEAHSNLGQLLLELTARGMRREDAYARVQEHAMEAWKTEGDFRARVSADPAVRAVLGEKELDEVFRLERYLSHIDAIFARVFPASSAS